MAHPSARDLRQRVRIERRGSTPTARGGSAGWETLIESRAAKLTPRPIGGSETVLAGRLQGTAVFDCWLRLDSETTAIRAGDRLVDARDETRVFNIRSALDLDGRRQWLLLQCELGVAHG